MSPERLHAERGSALILMPAAVLVVLVLGALAVDSAVMFLGERELADLSAAAANDAATAALRPDAFYGCGRLELDQGRAHQVAAEVAAARTSDAVTVSALDVQVRNGTAPPEVVVMASGTVDLVFSPALPGGPRTRTLSARSVAVPEMLGSGGATPGTC